MGNEMNAAACMPTSTTFTRPLPAPVATTSFDIDELLQLLDYFPADRAATLLDRFAAEIPLYNRELAAARSGADLGALARCAHNARGTAATFFCTRVVVLCDLLRSACSAGNAGLCLQLAAQLAAANDAALEELARMRRPGGALSRIGAACEVSRA
jgi:HPt (histidine-containing phosphotransfer) domain-containing protein